MNVKINGIKNVYKQSENPTFKEENGGVMKWFFCILTFFQ